MNSVGKDGRELIPLGGVVEEIIFQNDDNGYTVCTVDVGGEPVVMVGIMPYLSEAEEIRAMGEWVSHATYGRQFKVSYFEKNLPTHEAAILKYLSSGAIKGVGPKTAERIVSHFGKDTFDVIENTPSWLAEVPGISRKKAAEIGRLFSEQFGVRKVMMFFAEYFGMTLSVRIYKRWGSAAIDTVKNNPYILCEEIRGIGFEKADAMARGLGLSTDSPERIRAGLKFALNSAVYGAGNVYLPRAELVKNAANLLGVPSDAVSAGIESLCVSGDLCKKQFAGHEGIYLTEMFAAECYAAAKLTTLSKINLLGAIGNTDELIAANERDENISYEFLQKEAIKSALNSSVTIITGGPGTGKTTIIKAVISIFRKLEMKFALAAPTGRAAKRMTAATGYEAKTLHRLLEMGFSGDDKADFSRNENNPLEIDALIVDEFSMVDITLFSSLLKAVKPGTRLLLIGDSDQLPSVGAGNVLSDLIESKKFTVCRLNRIYRQAAESHIITNAHLINSGEPPVIDNKSNDFFYVRRQNSAQTAAAVVSLVCDRLPAKYGSAERIQVLCCSRKGECGVHNLNKLLQARLNPPSAAKKERKCADAIYRVGDRVMQTRNNYDLAWVSGGEDGVGVFNGDIGIITDIDAEDETVEIDFDGKICRYDFSSLDEVEHAYAITVHKSQGSEYPIVVFPIIDPPPMLCTRNLLYTGITRAKQIVVLAGSYTDICRMAKNNSYTPRYTGLRTILAQV